jgi:hypothetical protein
MRCRAQLLRMQMVQKVGYVVSIFKRKADLEKAVYNCRRIRCDIVHGPAMGVRANIIGRGHSSECPGRASLAIEKEKCAGRCVRAISRLRTASIWSLERIILNGAKACKGSSLPHWG